MAATIAVVYPHMNAIGGDGFWLVREPGGRVRAHRGLRPGRAPRDDRALPRQGLRRDPGARAGRSLDGRRRGRRLAGSRSSCARRSAAGCRSPRCSADASACPRGLPGLALGGRGKSEGARGAARRARLRRDLPASRASRRPRARSASCRRSPTRSTQLAHAGLDDFYRGDIGREIAADLERDRQPGDARRPRDATGPAWSSRCRSTLRGGDAVQLPAADPGARGAPDPRHLRAARHPAQRRRLRAPSRADRGDEARLRDPRPGVTDPDRLRRRSGGLPDARAASSARRRRST